MSDNRLPAKAAVAAEQVAFEIIVHAGEGRTKVFEAVKAWADGNRPSYQRLLGEAEDQLLLAHTAQTGFLQQEALNGHVPVSLLLVHAQDILMSATSEKELVTALVEAFERRLAAHA